MTSVSSAADPTAFFHDRTDAGRQLAQRLEQYRNSHPVVLALPRGGVVVGYEVARRLGAPLDVCVARKLGAPGRPEYAIGAIAPGGICLLDRAAIQSLGVSRAALEHVVAEEVVELQRRLQRYQAGGIGLEIRDRVVILVDDGLATGLTARAAIRNLRQRGARRVILAVPVCSPQAAADLRSEVDDLVCVAPPRDFQGVGRWYGDFRQVPDDVVLALLHAAQKPDHDPMTARQPQGERSTGSAPPREDSLYSNVERELIFPVGNAVLRGNLCIPPDAKGLVLFAHGSGSSRFSPRNRYVARALNQAGLATLLMDLLTPEEESADAATGDFRFDIRLLAGRLIGAVDWVGGDRSTQHLRLGCFGASTGAAAALIAAAERPDRVLAVVSRGGRPDLAGDALRRVRASTLLIVGGADRPVIGLNQAAFRELMAGGNELVIVPGATHLFEEPGALEEVAHLAADWFLRHLEPQAEGARSARSA